MVLLNKKTTYKIIAAFSRCCLAQAGMVEFSVPTTSENIYMMQNAGRPIK